MPDSLENATLDEVLDHVGPGKLIRSDVFTWMLERIRDLEERVEEGPSGRVDVPDFTGMRFGAALDALSQDSLPLNQSVAIDVAGAAVPSGVPENLQRIVVGHTPEAGRRVAAGTFVRLLIAATVSSNGGNGDGGVPAPVIVSFDPTEQHIGDVVTINGQNLRGTSVSVTMDDEEASIERLTDIAIDARIPESLSAPPDGESRLVTVTVDVDGQSVSDEDSFSVLSPLPDPRPEIDTVDPNLASEGEEVTVTGENFSDDVSAVRVVFTLSGADIEATVTSAQTDPSGPDEITFEVPSLSVPAISVVPFRIEIEGAPPSRPFNGLAIRP